MKLPLIKVDGDGNLEFLHDQNVQEVPILWQSICIHFIT